MLFLSEKVLKAFYAKKSETFILRNAIIGKSWTLSNYKVLLIKGRV